MTDDDRRRAAQAVLAIPFFNELWAEQETAAINATIHADYTDHEKRQAMAAEVRAIRNVLSRIRSIAGQTETAGRRAPA